MQKDVSDLFTQTYVIVMPKRVKYVRDTFKKMNITYTPFHATMASMIDKNSLISDGLLSTKSTLRINEVACALSHLGVIKKFFDSTRTNANTCLIFEDDIVLDTDCYDKVKKNLDMVPADWDLINFGRCWDNCSTQQKVNEFIVTSENSLCSHSYAVSRKGAKKILDACYPILVAVDRFYVNLALKKKLIMYSSSPRIFEQLKMTVDTYTDSSLGNNDTGIECVYIDNNKHAHFKYVVMGLALALILFIIYMRC